MGRPKSGQNRRSKQARLPEAFLDKALAVAENRGEPVGDVIEKAGSRNIDRALKRIKPATPSAKAGA